MLSASRVSNNLMSGRIARAGSNALGGWRRVPRRGPTFRRRPDRGPTLASPGFVLLWREAVRGFCFLFALFPCVTSLCHPSRRLHRFQVQRAVVSNSSIGAETLLSARHPTWHHRKRTRPSLLAPKQCASLRQNREASAIASKYGPVHPAVIEGQKKFRSPGTNTVSHASHKYEQLAPECRFG